MTEKKREFIDNLFNYALVLLGILSAAELQYATRVSENPLDLSLVFRVSVLPFIVLMPIWFVKELLKEEMTRRHRMYITEFCWEFWSFTLFSYMILLYVMQTSNLASMIAGGLVSFGLSVILIYAIIRAYTHTYRNGPYEDMVEFYQRRRSQVLRTILFIAAYLLMFLIIV